MLLIHQLSFCDPIYPLIFLLKPLKKKKINSNKIKKTFGSLKKHSIKWDGTSAKSVGHLVP